MFTVYEGYESHPHYSLAHHSKGNIILVLIELPYRFSTDLVLDLNCKLSAENVENMMILLIIERLQIFKKRRLIMAVAVLWKRQHIK